MSVYRLDRLLSPHSLAVIGASPRETSVGRHVVANIRAAGFPGAVHVVNPNYAAIEGIDTVKSLDAIDGPIDGQHVRQPFVTGGWAADVGAVAGTGVDAIHIWAFPVMGTAIGAGRFVDQAALGGSRADVAAVFGTQFCASGFN